TSVCAEARPLPGRDAVRTGISWVSGVSIVWFPARAGPVRYVRGPGAHEIMTVITLIVNATERKAEAAAGESLLSVLRYRFGLTGTKYGCGEGQCGACTVLLEGKAVRSCLTSAESAAGKKILTIEGLSQDGKLAPVQQAFLDEEAFQCGY